MHCTIDFAAGAMENWGCVTYREERLLVNEATSSTAIKKAIARTVCHELAHQWFGNLVTMEWWNFLYLNEGFARSATRALSRKCGVLIVTVDILHLCGS